MIDSIPSEQELTTLLGKDTYKYYKEICDTILSVLHPKIEAWDKGGRRGQYFHGYRLEKKDILIDLYMVREGVLKCEFSFQKRTFDQLLKQKELFTPTTQKLIEKQQELYTQTGGRIYLELFITPETLPDALRVISFL